MIIKTAPVLKDYIWGGTRLKEYWNKQSNSIIAESWELSLHKDGVCKASGGEYDGVPLDKIITPEMTGSRNYMDRFPLLIKLIDARQKLSVQVHPNDEYALCHENDYGKTEMWYIADCQSGGGIYLGFKQSTDKAAFMRAIQQGGVEDLLNFIPVKKGDSFLIEAGTIHAICEGVTICEVQQNSNVTYRVYDYNRTDFKGNKRQLHIEKALDVINFNKYTPQSAAKGNTLAECGYFTVKLYEFNGGITLNAGSGSFNAFTVMEGEGSIEGRNFIKGDTFFISAGFGNYSIKGNAKILLSSI